jgi:hypothetical protein
MVNQQKKKLNNIDTNNNTDTDNNIDTNNNIDTDEDMDINIIEDAIISTAIDVCNGTNFKNDNKDFLKFKIDANFILIKDLSISYSIIRKKLSSNSIIPLFVTVGLSIDSVCNNLSIITKNINKIKNIYSEIIIFIINTTDIKNKYINKYKEKKIKEEKEEDEIDILEMMKSSIVNHLNKIIRKIILDNNYESIDLLGVSFGGGVCVLLSQLKDKLKLNINNLILVCPSIKEGLINIPLTQKVILGWCLQDKTVSYNEIGKKYINQLNNHIKIISLTDLDSEEKDKTIENMEYFYHRIQNNIFDILQYTNNNTNISTNE